MINNISLFFSLVLLLFAESCNTTEPPPLPDETKPTLTLELDDVSCTEAWIELTTNNLPMPASLNVYNNDSLCNICNLTFQDTLLYFDSLLPSQVYKLKVTQTLGSITSITSNELSVTTMDTTSHNFTWQTFEFGEASAGGSILYDVAIIDENNIWAVGEIYMNDSLGNPDYKAYNTVHWDGQKWELKRIYTYSS